MMRLVNQEIGEEWICVAALAEDYRVFGAGMRVTMQIRDAAIFAVPWRWALVEELE